MCMISSVSNKIHINGERNSKLFESVCYTKVLARVAGVTDRVIARKLEREQKKKGKWERENIAYEQALRLGDIIKKYTLACKTPRF